jgi:hypothetical protein
MFLNAILHHQVPDFCEKKAKFRAGSFGGSFRMLGSVPTAAMQGYKISAYERTASTRQRLHEFTAKSPGIAKKQ